MKINKIILNGSQAKKYVKEIAALRLKIFRDFPYLYEGTFDYEIDYLNTYFNAQHSFVLLLEFQGMIVGVTTAIWAKEEVESFRKPFSDFGIDPATVLYFGESLLEPSFRGKGLGKLFFEEREKFARSLSFIKTMSFCAVEREDNHCLKPETYIPLDNFWKSQGFRKVPNLTTMFEWKDLDKDQSDNKKMQFWIKNTTGEENE